MFAFPILSCDRSGIAFRNRPADVLDVGATTAQLAQALGSDKGPRAEVVDQSQGTHDLATGRIVLLAIAKDSGVVYKYDDTNPEGDRRGWADRAVQKAAGQKEWRWRNRTI